MEDDLILNIYTNSNAALRSAAAAKKGGRWTDRLKAKRSQKRKATNSIRNSISNLERAPPSKKARTEKPLANRLDTSQPTTVAKPQNGQIISSLFSHNPTVDVSAGFTSVLSNSKPSNAPLRDSSTFTGLGLDPLISAHLSTRMSITKPTAIQRAALPSLLAPSSESSNQRDAFIQSQTGSGKTLSFLLPIIQDLLPLSSLSYIDRSIGTLAIIIAPTRELAKQISDVLEKMLQLRLRPQAESTKDEDEASNSRLTRWLVSGLLTGGATRAHEKARIRKGLPIIVSTPGRLLDHLQNTTSFNVGKCRWLVLDEADRLMELGFEESIQGIIKGLDGRRKLAVQAVEEGVSKEVGGWDWERRRRTVLCSATIREDVQKLAGTALVNPMMIKAMDFDKPNEIPATSSTAMDNNENAASSVKFTPPSQLSQKFIIVPLKLRLVALVALLRSLLANGPANRGTKIIVFMSCTDSVDYHWRLLGGTFMMKNNENELESSDTDDGSEEDNEEHSSDTLTENKIAIHSPLLPGASVYRLHGSLATPTRLASLRAFSALPSIKSTEKSKDKSSASASILFCTSVASRGLDLPLVRAVVQYDLPTEGGETEYVHRVGRTARVGKGGEAWSFVAPSEVPWVKWVEAKMKDDSSQSTHGAESDNKIILQPVSIETILHSGFGGKGNEYEQRATEVQLSFERWVLRGKENQDLARQAFRSHIRAYATHPASEKHIFHVKHLHLGHLAKAFALREAPGDVSNASRKSVPSGKKTDKLSGAKKPRAGKQRAAGHEWMENHDGDAERRMQEIVRAQGRLTKKGGVMMSSGVDEFQIAGGDTLEKLAGSRK